MKKTISEAEHLQLVGLKALADHHRLWLEGVERSMGEILGIEIDGSEDAGDLYSICHQKLSLDWALKGLGVVVAKGKKS